MDFFDLLSEKAETKEAPLAERLKPVAFDEFFGQSAVVGPGKPLRRLIEKDQLRSVILHGPPGTGKTSLAQIIAETTSSHFEKLNAVTSGVKDIRRVVAEAKERLAFSKTRTILFIDEIHRFNKSQQDALLPYVEKGRVTLIGATTENPYYEVNSALLSRSHVFRLTELSREELAEVLERALRDAEKGFGTRAITVSEDARQWLYHMASGDARRLLNYLEMAVLAEDEGQVTITEEMLSELTGQKVQRFDKSGDQHYDIISAFIKSMRGSDPDATLHYLARLIASGEDPLFIARRILICASEDVGNADPMALVLAQSAFDGVHKVGMPEGRILLAQAATYVASAPKSNASYLGINQALADLESEEIGPMPTYLKDGTSLAMEEKKQGQTLRTYRYPHDAPDHYLDQQYLPDAQAHKRYYRPTGQGEEQRLLAYFAKINHPKLGKK